MEIKGLTWMGTRTSEYSAMVHLVRHVLGLRLAQEHGDFAVFRTANGDTVDVIEPTDIEHRHFDAGPVVGCHVEGFAAARAELKAAGAVELIGPLRSWPDGNASQHVQAPDGNVYEVLGPLEDRNA